MLLGGGATIRIGREILCVPYAGFFFRYSLFYDKFNKEKKKKMIERWERL